MNVQEEAQRQNAGFMDGCIAHGTEGDLASWTSSMRPRTSLWLRTHGFTLGAGLIAALPVIGSTVKAVCLAWTPANDDGIIALRGFDVLSSHSPLLGQYSQASPLANGTVYSPGPMLYWALAIPTHLGAIAIVLTMGFISTGCVLGVVALAQRRGGRGLTLAVAGAVALLSRSIPVEVPYEIWNCWAGFFPFLLLIFIGWSVAEGEVRLLVPLALISSYCVQSHLTYALPTIGVVGVALGGLAFGRRRRTPDLGRVRRWGLAAGIVGIGCWIMPVIQQIGHSPGNLVLLSRIGTSNHGTVGLGTGLHMVERALGLMPLWTRAATTPFGRAVQLGTSPGAVTAVSALVVFGLLVGLLVVAAVRRRWALVAPTALSLTLALTLAITAAATPTGTLGFASSTYTLVWASTAGMVAYLTLGWAIAMSLGQHRLRLWSPILLSRAGIGVVALVAVLATARSGDDPNRFPPGFKNFARIRTDAEKAVAAVTGSRKVLINVSLFVSAGPAYQSALAYALRRHEITFAVPPRVAVETGVSYCPTPGPYRDVLTIANGNSPIVPGARLLARSSEVTLSLRHFNSDAQASHDPLEARVRQDQRSYVAPSVASPC